MKIEEIVSGFRNMTEVPHRKKGENEFNVTDLFVCAEKTRLIREGKEADRPKEETNWMRQGTISSFVHWAMQEVLEGNGWLIPDKGSSYFKRFGEYRLFCKPDAIKVKGDRWYEDLSAIEVVEIKCPMWFSGNAFDNHLFQVGIYMNILGAARGTLMYLHNNGFANIDCEKMEDDDIVWLIENRKSPNFDKECVGCWYRKYCEVKK